LKSSIENAVVVSKIDGMVKSINSSGESSSSGVTGEEAFMTIFATGNFRIKGSVNEQNISLIATGQSVIIHSRVDDGQIWKGTLTTVDLENPITSQSSDMYYYGTTSSDNSSSSYPFYIDMESIEGLMLGQHVYIEMDYGQTQAREGLWLDSYYIVQEEENAYVWAANEKNRIEKREVTLGEYDEELVQYEITEGLTVDDYIAFPDATVTEGAKAEKNIDNIITDDPEGLYNSETGLEEDGYPDEYDADEFDESDIFDKEVEDIGGELIPGTVIDGTETLE